MSDKPKRQMTPEQLEKLAQAREKAVEKRRQLGEITRKEKAMKELELTERMKKVGLTKQEAEEQSEEEVVNAPTKSKPVPISPRRKVVVDSSSESDSDDEDEVEVLKAVKQKYKHKYAQKYKSKYNTSALKENANQVIKKQVNDELLKMAMASIFPCY
jgi:hypothetical protein